MNGIECPVPQDRHTEIQLAHGGGGKLTNRLIEQYILPAFRNDALAPLHDGAVVRIGGTRLAFSTDAHVVSPIAFPGGDIGELAVNGTVNDLAMCGARPLFLSVAFVIEEGLSLQEFSKILQSMRRAADAAGVSLVTGDTKVVERGKADRIFITTSGIGELPPACEIDPRRATAGDAVILSGPIGLHGMAVLSRRQGLEIESPIESDTAPLNGLVEAIVAAGGNAVHVLRDPTRGGVASALNEIAVSASAGIEIFETAIRVPEPVAAACDMLGLDPLYVANEGKLIAIVDPAIAHAVVEAMHAHPLGSESAVIGTVTADHAGVVVLRTAIGGKRIVDMLSGEQLPRIC